MAQRVRVITNTLRYDDDISRNDNPLKQNVIIITSKGTLSARHGPKVVADFAEKKGHMSKAQAKSHSKTLQLPLDDLPERLNGRIGITVIDEAHNLGGHVNDAWLAIRWLAADYYVVLTATPDPWGTDKPSSMLAVLHDPGHNADAATLIKRNLLSDPYKTQDPGGQDLSRFHSTFAAFSYIFDHSAGPMRHGEMQSKALAQVMVRSTYQSTCVTHPSGDVHSLQELMPPSVPVRIHVTNSEPTCKIWAEESKEPVARLHHKDKNAPPHMKDKLLVNGKYAQILNLGSFCVLLFFATDIHDVTDNDIITQYQSLHNQGYCKDYLWHLLSNIYKSGVVAKGSPKLAFFFTTRPRDCW